MNQESLALSWIEKTTPYLNFSLLFLSVIIFVDILFVFKKPKSLKFLFLAIAICTFISNWASLFTWSTDFKYIPRIMNFFFYIQILYHLYNHTYSKKLNISFLAILLFSIFNIYTHNLISPETHDFLFWTRRIFRISSIIMLIYISIYVYQNLQLNLKKENIAAKKIETWTRITIVLLLLGIFSNAIQLLGEKYIPIALMLSCVIQIICCFGIIFRPDFINRSELSTKGLTANVKKGKNGIDENIFIHEFYTKHYYINANASDLEFSNVLGVTVQSLHDYISKTTNGDFNDLINKNRVDYFIMLSSRKEFKESTIEELSKHAGFGTRNNFYRYFKKFHGGIPSDLIRMYE